MVQFTDAFIRNISSQGYHFDEKLPGFGLRVGQRVKAFVCVRGGKRITLGKYPHLSLTEARKRAVQHLHNPEPDLPLFTVAEAVDAYLKTIQVRPNTLRSYTLFTGKLKRKHGQLRLAQMTPRMVAEAVESPHMHLALKVFFNWCKGQALLTQSPMENLKQPGSFGQRSRVLTDEEIHKVWHASKELGKFGMIVRLLILTGQRRSEIAGLRPEWLSTP